MAIPAWKIAIFLIAALLLLGFLSVLFFGKVG